MEMEELGRPGLAAGVCPDLGHDPVVAVFFFQTNMMLGNNG